MENKKEKPISIKIKLGEGKDIKLGGGSFMWWIMFFTLLDLWWFDNPGWLPSLQNIVPAILNAIQ